MASNASDVQMADVSSNQTMFDGDKEPVRKYLNTKVTGVLMEGMKKIGAEQPKDPLRALGEYLIQRSKELEGTQ